MTIESYLAYLAALLIAVASPGPAMIAVVATAAKGGTRSGMAAGLGVALADVLLVGAALAGLATLMLAFEPALLAVKLLGGAYLIWIGIRMWRAPILDDSAILAKGGRPLATGFAVGLSNPKAILFHASLMPLVIDLARVDAIVALVLAATVAIVNLIVMSGFALVAGRGRNALRSPKGQRILNRTAGGAMVGAGTVVLAR